MSPESPRQTKAKNSEGIAATLQSGLVFCKPVPPSMQYELSLRVRITVVAIVMILSAAAYAFVASGSFSSCATGSFTDAQQKTISSLDTIIDLGLKLATTLIGFGAAVLIGVK